MPADKVKTVFLFDVDNTLLDNDSVIQDVGEHLEKELSKATRERYFAIFEELRKELGYADYLGALQRYRAEHPEQVRLLELSQFFLEYPFEERLYPGALDVVRRMGEFGTTAVLSDGDVVFQPLKVRKSGIYSAVEGRVMIYIHKEQMLADVEKRYSAERYVFVDDKPRLVKAIKAYWGKRVTTVWPRQGHYAAEVKGDACEGADVVVERIGELLGMDVAKLARG